MLVIKLEPTKGKAFPSVFSDGEPLLKFLENLSSIFFYFCEVNTYCSVHIGWYTFPFLIQKIRKVK